MKLIANQPFVNLDNFLDIEAFDALSTDINWAIAKNHNALEICFAQQTTSLAQVDNFYEIEKAKIENIAPNKKAEDLFIKLKGAPTLGYRFVLAYSPNFFKKHKKDDMIFNKFVDDFKFLFDWIDKQGIFSSYGRVMFFISEPNTEGTIHSDYPEWARENPDVKDMFVWITGPIMKQMFLCESLEGERAYSTSKALLFDNTNFHGSSNTNDCMAWALRIDGIFSEEFAKKAGIYEHFKTVISKNSV
jgi:hypothetical protein